MTEFLCSLGFHKWGKWEHTECEIKDTPVIMGVKFDEWAETKEGVLSERYCKRCNTRDRKLEKL